MGRNIAKMKSIANVFRFIKGISKSRESKEKLVENIEKNQIVSSVPKREGCSVKWLLNRREKDKGFNIRMYRVQ